ncbi:MAG: hypothetical protein KF841_11975 [Phycisphaerae bacterium]|nr:hypothetical protein [Phycisphaerae bacterium]
MRRSVKVQPLLRLGLSCAIGTLLIPLAAATPTEAPPTTTEPDSLHLTSSAPDGASSATQPATAGEAAIARRCAGLIESADRQTEPIARAHAFIVAARCLIVDECAAPLSVELCWSARPAPSLGELLSRAEACLASAESSLRAADASADEAVVRRLADRLEMLRSFARLFSAMADLDAGSEVSRSRLIDAGVGVSTYLDDPNAAVAQSARLWQGVAYRRAGRPDRSLQILWPAIGSLSSNRLDFFARVERCRALADQKRYVAALALAVKLEEHLDECMKPEDVRARAADSLRWARIIIYRRWSETLRAEGKNQRARSAESSAAGLQGGDPDPLPSDRWLQLTETIAGLPDWATP